MSVYKTVAAGDIARQLCVCTLLPSVFFFLPLSRSHQIAHFSETRDKMSLFLPHFYVTVLCQQKETFIDFVSGCTEVRAAAAPLHSQIYNPGCR